MKKIIYSFVFASMSFIANAGFAQSSPISVFVAPPTETIRSMSDAEYTAMQAIHMGNLTEMRAAITAFDKATTIETKNYALVLLNEHSQNEIQLQQMALNYGVNFDEGRIETDLIPMKLRAESTLATLRLTGASRFQNAFAKAMENTHADLLQQLDRLEPNLVSTEINDFVTTTHAVVERHQTMAQSLEQ